jgi:CheY-like chemotaxis protein
LTLRGVDEDEDKIVGGHERVLLVEDEDMVRLLVTDMLELAGYEVEAADGGERAKRLFKGSADFDLLITDVVMPGISGRELAALFSERYPGAGVLFTSGYTDGAISKQGLLDDDVAYLQKPFSAAGLTRKMRVVLDQQKGNP